ncbi:Cell death protease [Steccherinum ochraceum]|uniref:Pheromone-processing carboxypeptidase KEX1 n=1 Tax=Steccherinum ochraceum TaxID=92696 RepID=A0A4R0RSK8_9APHY|nr:Cell death protease [Steccherinum ochraceum]
MISALSSGFLWALLPLSFFAATTYAAPTDGLPSAQSFYVSHIPDLHQDPDRPLRIYAGHLSSDPNATAVAAPTDLPQQLYFVIVKARRTADKERVIFWLNGGPGCSSFDGLMMEVGPWRVDGSGGLRAIEGGWEEYTTVVYVDQPVGTGFSISPSNKYLHELPDASRHWLQFLENFYTVFPEYKEMDTYLAGESFAGQYIPYFGQYLLPAAVSPNVLVPSDPSTAANAMLDSNLNLPLNGAAIGNGWIDGRSQYPSFLEYALKHQLVEANSDDYKRGKDITDRCMTDFDKEASTLDLEPIHTGLCESVLQTVIEHKTQFNKGKLMCLNMYDVRLDDVAPACGMNWPPDLKDIGTYLHRPDVVRALHATAAPVPWTECRGVIHTNFNTRHSNSSITIIPRMLERIPLMLFAGDQDFICNYVGIETLVQSMTWNGEKGLGTVQTQTWSVNNTAAGTWVTSRNLTYVKIFNASHMVGYDVPHVSHDMMLRFMGVNFSAITEGSARIPSSLGSDNKPVPILVTEDPTPTPVPGKTKEQNKAMWEAYYNAGSAALVLVIIAVLIAGFLFWRSRQKQHAVGLPLSREDIQEENIPLTSSNGNLDDHHREDRDDDDDDGSRMRKGKGRAGSALTPHEEIFGVGDDEDEDSRSPARQ